MFVKWMMKYSEARTLLYLMKQKIDFIQLKLLWLQL